MTWETGLVNGASGKIYPVTVLTVGKSFRSPRAWIVTRKCAVIDSGAPGCRIDGGIAMAGDTVTQGGIETSGVPPDVLNLRGTARIGAVGMTYRTDGIVAGIGIRVTKAPGGSGAPPGSRGMRCVIQQSVAAEDIDA